MWGAAIDISNRQGDAQVPLRSYDCERRNPCGDDLKAGGETLIGTLKIKSLDASVRLVGGFLENGEARLKLNRPIDLVIGAWRPRALTGIAADGRSISLLLEPVPSPSTALNVAVLVDHSGSMNEPASAGAHPISKHGLVVAGLRSLSDQLRNSDLVDLWEFDNIAHRIGSTGGDSRWLDNVLPGSAGRKLRNLTDRLAAPVGGTEIGSAIAATIDQSPAQDVLLITDGKSHALDVQTLARKGRRIFVVLIGEDSLEANVGHLHLE